MTIHIQIRDHWGCIALSGRFDYRTHREFTEAYTRLLDNATVNKIEIEMSGVDYIDSSALGMLLLLHYRALAVNKPVVLLNLSPVASHALEVAHFGSIFNFKRTA
jgi:anti-anti-sigma factor